MRARFAFLAVPLLIGLGAGCGGPATPPGLPYTVQADGGVPVSGAPGVFASTSLADLRAMVAGMTTASEPGCPGCWPAVNPASGQVYIAAWTTIPCTTASLSAAVSGKVVTLLVRSKNACKPGEFTTVAPQLSLISVRQSDLPQDVITIKLSHVGDTGGSTDPRLTSFTTIDLAQPAVALPAVDTRADEVRAVLSAARQAAAKQLKTSVGALQVMELGTRRWPDASLGCGSQSTNPVPITTYGYEVELALPGGSPLTYHATLKSLLSC